MNFRKWFKLIDERCSQCIETSRLTSAANQLTGFYLIETSANTVLRKVTFQEICCLLT